LPLYVPLIIRDCIALRFQHVSICATDFPDFGDGGDTGVRGAGGCTLNRAAESKMEISDEAIHSWADLHGGSR